MAGANQHALNMLGLVAGVGAIGAAAYALIFGSSAAAAADPANDTAAPPDPRGSGNDTATPMFLPIVIAAPRPPPAPRVYWNPRPVPPIAYDPGPPGGPIPPIMHDPGPGVFATSLAGRARIKSEEALQLTAYRDGAGYSIGYGHHLHSGESYPNGVTLAQAESLFAADLADVERGVNSLVTVPLNQNQFDAIADLVYNIGLTQFGRSTLLRKLNAGDYSGAGSEFSRWVFADGARNPDLVQRRATDQALFAAGTQAGQFYG